MNNNRGMEEIKDYSSCDNHTWSIYLVSKCKCNAYNAHILLVCSSLGLAYYESCITCDAVVLDAVASDGNICYTIAVVWVSAAM